MPHSTIVQVQEKALHLRRLLDMGKMAALREGYVPEVRNQVCEPCRVRWRREDIAFPTDRQGRATNIPPLIEVVLCCCACSRGEAGGPGIPSKAADHLAGDG